MADDTDTARRALDERLDRAFEGATPAPIIAAIDALIAAVRAERDAPTCTRCHLPYLDGRMCSASNFTVPCRAR